MTANQQRSWNVVPGRIVPQRSKSVGTRSAAMLMAVALVWLAAGSVVRAQDVPDSKDPAGMKRYEGSELIGYRRPTIR